MLEWVGPWMSDELSRRVGLPEWLAALAVPLGFILGGYVAGLVVERMLLVGLRGAKGTSTRLDDVLARSLQGPVRGFALLLGLGLALLATTLPASMHEGVRFLLGVLVGVTVIVVLARFLVGLIDAYGERASLDAPSRSLSRRIVLLAVWSLGILFILQLHGINVTPLLTTLGLAGLALALAVQDTLSNVFAGAYIQADKPLAVGHYVRFEEHKIEGFVVEVGWRTTKIRTLGNNLVVIPNSRAASSIVTDYDLPEPRMSVLVNVPIALGPDPDAVAKLIEQVAREHAGRIDGFLQEPAPFVRFIPGFTENGFEFTLVAHVRTFVDQYAVQDELRRLIDARLRAEGIALGAPRRVFAAPAPAQP